MRGFYLSSAVYIVGFIFFAILSYSLTDPNLVLSNNQLYWSFQTWIWKTIFSNSTLQGNVFFFLFTFLIISYLSVLYFIQKNIVASKNIVQLITVICLLLFISYNALSHDIFNYIFNAKMVLNYNVDPHQVAANNFAQDEWVRFMHNVHTTAPYGYGWTAFSLIPSFLGFNKFVLTYVCFKLASLFSFVALVFLALKTAKDTHSVWLVLLNPLLLIEIVSSGHNDFFMIVPAVLSVYIFSKKQSIKNYIFATLLIVISISIKLATIVLLPLILVLLYTNVIKNKSSFIASLHIENNWPLYASILMFIPLVTERSQQFHPWYLSWSIVWLIYFNNKRQSVFHNMWKVSIILFSFSSLYRYLPWIYNGNFSSLVIQQQKMITWILPVIGILIYLSIQLYKSKITKH